MNLRRVLDSERDTAWPCEAPRRAHGRAQGIGGATVHALDDQGIPTPSSDAVGAGTDPRRFMGGAT
jgi:hypothetical protein